MNFPPFFYSLKFWEAVAWVLAGVLALLVYFGVIGPEFGLTAAAILAIIKGVLKWLGVEPELRAKGLLPATKKSKK